MNLILRVIVTAALVMLISFLMKSSVRIDGFSTALIVAIVLGLLNFFVKPILVLFTLPITIITLGLFYLIINAIIILLCDKLVDGFDVTSIWSALLFSIILSISQSFVYKLTDSKK